MKLTLDALKQGMDRVPPNWRKPVVAVATAVGITMLVRKLRHRHQ
jgi:hypothetical protein